METVQRFSGDDLDELCPQEKSELDGVSLHPSHHLGGASLRARHRALFVARIVPSSCGQRFRAVFRHLLSVLLLPSVSKRDTAGPATIPGLGEKSR
jgi:hypothetical protein